MIGIKLRKILAVGVPVLMFVSLGNISYAGPPTISTTHVNDLVNGGMVASASSKIIRTDNGITVSVKTTVDPGAYTMWLLVWNEPWNCEGGIPGLRCVPPPIGPDVPSCVLFGTGQVVGNNGTLNYTAHRQAWDASDSVGPPCLNGITNPRGADVHAAVRTHGKKIPGLVDDQIHTFGGGCSPENPCSEIQAAAHEEPLP